jgi:hypothetical protein
MYQTHEDTIAQFQSGGHACVRGMVFDTQAWSTAGLVRADPKHEENGHITIDRITQIASSRPSTSVSTSRRIFYIRTATLQASRKKTLGIRC